MYSVLQGKWRYVVAMREVIQNATNRAGRQAWLLIALYILVIMHAATEPFRSLQRVKGRRRAANARAVRRLSPPNRIASLLPKLRISPNSSPLQKYFLCALRANRALRRALPAAHGTFLLFLPNPLYHTTQEKVKG